MSSFIILIFLVAIICCFCVYYSTDEDSDDLRESKYQLSPRFMGLAPEYLFSKMKGQFMLDNNMALFMLVEEYSTFEHENALPATIILKQKTDDENDSLNLKLGYSFQLWWDNVIAVITDGVRNKVEHVKEIKDQIVGNTLAPLLCIVNVQGNYKDISKSKLTINSTRESSSKNPGPGYQIDEDSQSLNTSDIDTLIGTE
uniref:Uncharacterized protein n=1 Tax=Romanomermis culicivorax TaxID=13658 RepID=A0A915HR18_ROMCU